jgi:hypothetical protein
MTGDLGVGIIIGFLLVLIAVIIYDQIKKNLIRESIYSPEKFKVRQEEFTRNLKDRLP